MSKILCGAVAALVLAGCANQAPIAAYRSNQYRDCLSAVATNPDFAPIALKTSTGRVEALTTAMLSDESFPTDQEKPVIALWADARTRCFSTFTSTLKEDLPPEVFEVQKISVDRARLLAADLYAGKLTYGQFNRTRVQQNSAAESALEQIRQLYAARQDQENQQRRQVLLMQLQNQLSRPVPPPPAVQPYMIPTQPTVTTNCTTVGNQVYCNSR